MMQVAIIGRYRVYRGNRSWIVRSDHGEISRHADRPLAVAAAQRYADGDARRAKAREQQHGRTA